jgi:4,5-DOPA dioxygenase extradiol
MQRRTLLTATAATTAHIMTSIANAAALPLTQVLQPSAPMPVMFLGHGSPMNAIEDNTWRRSWQDMGAEILSRSERPQLILCISAHWLTRGNWQITAMAHPKTIHDFGGFPQALFDQQYPAPGAPAAAERIAKELKSPSLGAHLAIDKTEWGLDHGTWSVLKPMFPKADIPVIQLSMDYSRPPAEHYALGQQLHQLRSKGVLIVGSGNIVHNLRAIRMQAASHEVYDWAQEFDTFVQEQIKSSQLDKLQNFLELGAVAKQAHPSYEHYLPLLYTAGAVRSNEMPRFFNVGFQAASISMRSVIWG